MCPSFSFLKPSSEQCKLCKKVSSKKLFHSFFCLFFFFFFNYFSDETFNIYYNVLKMVFKKTKGWHISYTKRKHRLDFFFFLIFAHTHMYILIHTYTQGLAELSLGFGIPIQKTLLLEQYLPFFVFLSSLCFKDYITNYTLFKPDPEVLCLVIAFDIATILWQIVPFHCQQPIFKNLSFQLRPEEVITRW